jgi:hypothetical protein
MPVPTSNATTAVEAATNAKRNFTLSRPPRSFQFFEQTFGAYADSHSTYADLRHSRDDQAKSGVGRHRAIYSCFYVQAMSGV